MDESALRREARSHLDARFNIYGWNYVPTDVERTMRMIEPEHNLPGLASGRTALRALVYNERHVEHLRAEDPTLLRQITKALPEFDGVPEERIVHPWPEAVPS